MIVCCMYFKSEKAIAADTWVWPVPSVGVGQNISTHFGEITDYDPSGHEGIDIYSDLNTRIVASKSGTVCRVVHGDIAGEYMGAGNAVVIDHGNGVYSHYAHLNSTAVSEGQHVQAGETIGYMGRTGVATGVHLHFAIANNSYGGGGRINNEPGQVTYIAFDISGQIRSSGLETMVQKTKDGLWLYGWAFDSKNPSIPVSITVVVGGPYGSSGADHISLGQTHEYRSEINSGIGITGFNKTVHTPFAGEQPVYVYAETDSTRELIDYKIMNVGSLPIGHVDDVTSTCAGTVLIDGWALDADYEGYSSNVMVNIGTSSTKETVAADVNGNRLLAGKYRPDVNSVFNGTVGDYHGFRYFIPTTKTGTQTVDIYGMNVGNGYDVSIGQETITISTAPHSFNDGNVIQAATISSAGSMEHTCSKCEITEIVEIPQIAGMSLGAVSYSYDGTAKEPSVTVKDVDGTTVASSNYSVSYANNVNPGTATVTVTFSGRMYSGELSETFEITSSHTDPDIILPADLTTIESEAFANLDSTVSILVPETVIFIADDAFADSDVIIIAPAGSYAIQWAEANNVAYVEQ